MRLLAILTEVAGATPKPLRVMYIFCLLLLSVEAFGATHIPSTSLAKRWKSIQTVDPDATRQTKALFANLRSVAQQHILFGHQDALAYGVMWKEWHRRRSDVMDACGHYPAVFGWEIGKLGQRDISIDTVEFLALRRWISEAYRMGGINTISWHVDNFLTGGSSWDVGENVVAAILPGGDRHDAYIERLDVLADFFHSLRVGFVIKRRIPIIFRPFHEHTGSWFWWGQPHCTPEQYRELWQFTVRYLRDVRKVRNVLYCYSTDIFQDEEHYLECYPGDEYVDIMGMDDYHDVKPENDPAELTRRLRILVELAEARGKVPALTETGLSGIPETSWWTDRLLQHIKADPIATRIAWVLVWRNARTTHHYAPYPGHPSLPNFIEFCEDPLILMEDNLPRMYKLDEIALE